LPSSVEHPLTGLARKYSEIRLLADLSFPLTLGRRPKFSGGIGEPHRLLRKRPPVDLRAFR
jgi:hypothetical protein